MAARGEEDLSCPRAGERERNSVDRVFSVLEYMDAPREPELLLNIAMHEETVTGVRRRLLAGDVGKLKMKLGRSTVAPQGGGPSDWRTRDLTVTGQQQVQRMLSFAVAVFHDIVNNHNYLAR